jgi:Cof subfamily protein (haloacid dehalogenase superfamily)
MNHDNDNKGLGNPAFPFKLAAIDIDDTLVGPDKRIGAANRDAVRRLAGAGCRVVLASGRRHANMLPFYRELGLDDFAVSCQGAVARHTATGEVAHEATVPMPAAAEVTADGLERGLTVMYWSADGIFARQRTHWVERYSADCGGDPVALADIETLAGQGAPRAEKVVWGAEPGVIASLAPVMRARYRDRLLITVTDDWFMEFTSPHAHKAAGVAAVAARYGVDARHVLAFGDGNNDVQLLAWAGLGVAMDHGRPAARAAATRVAPPGSPESALSRAVDDVFATPPCAAAQDDASPMVEAA